MSRKRKSLTQYPIRIRLGTLEDIPKVLTIAHQYPKELGFVRKVALEQSIFRTTLLVADYEDVSTVGFVSYYTRKDGWNTIYEIATDKSFRGLGVGRFLLQATPTPTQLKCTVDNEANIFYEKNGFVKTTTVQGRKRKLNVWKRKALVILCKGSSEIIKGIHIRAGMAYGTRHSEKPLYQPFLVDIHWDKYDWEDYLEKIIAWKPVMALAPDFILPEQQEKLYQQIEELQQVGVLRVGVCPKFVGATKLIPPDCIVCVSIPTKYAGFLPPKEELVGRKIHLLGGSPQKQFEYIKKHPEIRIISADSNSFTHHATHGVYYSAEYTCWKILPKHSLSTQAIIELSAQNIMQAWKSL